MRRMLDPKEAGGSLPSTITFDENGNRTVGKNLEVDGKLKLKSLVSASNPDGDITKALGGAKLYKHTISAFSGNYGRIVITFYNYSDVAIDSVDKLKNAINIIDSVAAVGWIKENNIAFNVYEVLKNYKGDVFSMGYRIDPNSGNITSGSVNIDNNFSLSDELAQVS